MTSLPALKMMESAESVVCSFVGTKIRQQTAHQAAVVGLACDLVVLRGLLRGLLLRVLRFPFVCHVLYPF